MDNKNKVKQDGYKVNIDSKYGNYIKLGLAALTAFGLVGTGAHQAGIIDVFPDDEVKCAHDNNTVGDVRLNLNVKGTK
jgi:hypothetical protein